MDIRMSNIASPMPQIRAKFTNKLGIPLSGCKVYTYEPNSNILKTTWLDIDKTTENTNPILLDAAGEADIFLDGLYRIVVKDRFNFTVYDVEKTGNEPPVFNDGLLLTWSGLTQEEKNKDSPSPQDFKAKGDGVTNDTQAFLDLEAQYQGREIDLLGKTYLVDRDFNKNLYRNGYFKIGNVSKRQGVRNFTTSCPLEDKSGLFLSSFDGGIQGAILNEWDNILYILQGVDGSVGDNTERNKILAVRWNGQSELTPIWETLPSTSIGHQSLGIQRVAYGTRNTPGVLKIWSLAGVDKGFDRSKYAVRFEIAGGVSPSVVEHYKLWSDDVVGGTRVMGTDQNSSILVMTGIRADGWYCRVFDMSIFSDGGGDYSDKYLYEFKTNDVLGVALQDMTTDGKYVYLYHGGTAFSATNKYLEVYTIDGIHVRTMKTTVGALRAWDISEGGGTLMYEPEAIFFDGDGQLVFGNTNGVPLGKTKGESSFFKLKANQAMRLKPSNSTTPAIISDAAIDVAVPNNQAYGIGYVYPDGSLTQFYTVKDSEVRHTAITGTFIQYLTGSEAQSRLSNQSRVCGLNISAVGNFGLYDFTNSAWLIQSNNAGTVLSINSGVRMPDVVSKVYASNAAAITGGLVAGDLYRTSTGQLMIVY